MTDSKQSRQSLVIIIVCSVIILGRALVGTDVAYSLFEPVFTRFGQFSQHFVTTRAQFASESDQRNLADQVLREENETLREQLQLGAQEADGGILAAVILREVSGFNKSLWINKGRLGGVAKNDAVLARGYVIGRIMQVHEKSAEVELIIDPSFKTTVKTKNGKHGILEMQKGSLIVDLLPEHGMGGSLIYTDGLDATFENALPIGELAAEFGGVGDVFGKYYVQLPYNPLDVDFVRVLTRATEKQQ